MIQMKRAAQVQCIHVHVINCNNARARGGQIEGEEACLGMLEHFLYLVLAHGVLRVVLLLRVAPLRVQLVDLAGHFAVLLKVERLHTLRTRSSISHSRTRWKHRYRRKHRHTHRNKEKQQEQAQAPPPAEAHVKVEAKNKDST